MDGTLIETGSWGQDLAWELFATDQTPPLELTTAVMCIALSGDKICLARSQRGWGVLGGHIEDGETHDQALQRECLEEGGFVIDQSHAFAVRKITAKQPAPHQQSGKFYPFPHSYIAYYWATTNTALLQPTGQEIIERQLFAIDNLATQITTDHPIIIHGLQACRQRSVRTVPSPPPHSH